jgi:hypothetical protein
MNEQISRIALGLTAAVLTFVVAGTLQAAVIFTEDFSDSTPNDDTSVAHMSLGPPGNHGSEPTTDFIDDFTITSGTDARIYLGTDDADYSTVSFIFEAELTVPNTDNPWAIAFMGMGSTQPDGDYYEEPVEYPHLIAAADPRSNELISRQTDEAPSDRTSADAGGELSGNTHLVRMRWDAATREAIFEFDVYNDGGPIVGFTLDDVENNLTGTNSQLLVGGGNGISFDNISVRVVPEPACGMLLILAGLGLLARRR